MVVTLHNKTMGEVDPDDMLIALHKLHSGGKNGTY